MNKLNCWGQLSKFGHTIDIFGDVKGDFSKYKYGKIYPISEGYYPTSDKYDLLLVECGATNIMFENNSTHRKYFVEFHEMLSKWHGKVIYLHYDPLLPMYMDLDEFHSPKWIEQSNNFGTKDLLKDREFYIVTFSQDTKAFYEYWWERYRVCYKYAKKCYSVMTPSNPKEYVMDINKKPEYYEIYIGNNVSKSRTKKLLKFYGHGKCKVDIFGKWSDKRMESFPNVSFYGAIPQMSSFAINNNAMFNVIIADQIGEKLDIFGNRLWDGVQSRCITLVDKKLKTYSKIIGNEFAVESIEEALSWVPDIDDYKKRKEILDYQLWECEKADMYNIYGKQMDKILHSVIND